MSIIFQKMKRRYSGKLLLEVLCYKVYLFKYHRLLLYYSTCLFKLRSSLRRVVVGKSPTVWGKCIIIKFPGSVVQIGDRFHCVSDRIRASAATVNITRIKTFTGEARVIIGNSVGLNGTSIVCRSTSVSIGDHTKIGPDCIITDTDFHGIEPDKRLQSFPELDRAVNIGRNVWIGMRCIVLKGVTVGDNSIIGAGSVVTRDVEPNSIYAGNPARFIRKI